MKVGKTFIRVDDRLIHGQTIVAWCPTLGIEEIIAVDDESAMNPMLKSIMTMGVPKSYKAHIVTTIEAGTILQQDSPQNRLVIVKYPVKLAQLGEAVLHCENIVLGNIAKRPDTAYKVNGATRIFYLSDQDVEMIDSLVERGAKVTFQQLPATSATSWDSFKKSI